MNATSKGVPLSEQRKDVIMRKPDELVPFLISVGATVFLAGLILSAILVFG